MGSTMSDLQEQEPVQEQVQQTQGTIIEQREYTDEEMHALIDGTMTDFDEGDLVSGVVVKVERDEVLLDIGYKSEGVIPARELSIRKDANPADIVSTGDEIESLGKSFNEMIESLAATRREVAEHNEHLEAKIRERLDSYRERDRTARDRSGDK